MAIVIDVSVAAAWCFPDEQADSAERVLEHLPRVGGVIPSLFRHELRTILIVNERRGRIDQADSARFLMRLRALRLLHDDAHDEDTVMALARKHMLSACDFRLSGDRVAPRRQPGHPRQEPGARRLRRERHPGLTRARFA